VAGTYDVYAWWITGGSRATNAPYTINYDGGSETVRVNQKATTGQWNYLGTYPFAAGAASVVLSDGPGANGSVLADAIILATIEGKFAPNVIGNDVDYGFYVTGHNMACTACHDASENHIDHFHRTYASAADNYQAGYRLKSVDGGEPMNIPRPSGNPIDNWQDFALCFDCHSRVAVLGTSQSDVSGTNFWDDDGSIRNSHNYHLAISSTHFDSDFDGTADSVETCTACHNVHGSPTPAMVRNGELISREDALNFGYVTTLSDPNIDPNAILPDSIAGKMDLAGNTIEATGVCNACHGAMIYYRSPNPVVIIDNPAAVFNPDGNWSTSSTSPDRYGADFRYKAGGTGSDTGTWTPDVTYAGTYDVYAWWVTGGSRATNAPYTINYNGGSETVRVNQKATTGQWNLLGTYPFAAGTAGSVELSDGPGADGVVVGDAILLELQP
jgi:cytochrome c553